MKTWAKQTVRSCPSLPWGSLPSQLRSSVSLYQREERLWATVPWLGGHSGKDGLKLLLHQHGCDWVAVPKLSDLDWLARFLCVFVTANPAEVEFVSAGWEMKRWSSCWRKTCRLLPSGWAGSLLCGCENPAACQAGQAPSFPQLDLTLGDNAAHIWLASVSLSSSFSYPLQFRSPNPCLCVREGDVGVSQAFPPEMAGCCFDSPAHSSLVSFCIPSSTPVMTKTQVSSSFLFLFETQEHKFLSLNTSSSSVGPHKFMWRAVLGKEKVPGERNHQTPHLLNSLPWDIGQIFNLHSYLCDGNNLHFKLEWESLNSFQNYTLAIQTSKVWVSLGILDQPLSYCLITEFLPLASCFFFATPVMTFSILSFLSVYIFFWLEL